MLFSSFKNLVSLFRQSNRGLTKSNTSNQFCKPVVGLCALLCMSLWISVAQAQQMETALVIRDFIPDSSLTAGYTEADEVIAATDDSFQDPDGPDDPQVGVVDWIEVQIRVVTQGAIAPEALPTNADNVYTKAAWLLSDGSIVNALDADGNVTDPNAADLTLTIPTGDEGLNFDPLTQELYIVVNHRNHLAIMSRDAVPADDPDSVDDDPEVYEYDFTTAEDTARGLPLVLNNRVYAIRAGSVTDDNRINVLDDPPVIANTFSTGVSDGYELHDVNLDGRVNILDDPPIAAENSPQSSPITY